MVVYQPLMDTFYYLSVPEGRGSRNILQTIKVSAKYASRIFFEYLYNFSRGLQCTRREFIKLGFSAVKLSFYTRGWRDRIILCKCYSFWAK